MFPSLQPEMGFPGDRTSISKLNIYARASTQDAARALPTNSGSPTSLFDVNVLQASLDPEVSLQTVRFGYRLYPHLRFPPVYYLGLAESDVGEGL